MSLTSKNSNMSMAIIGNETSIEENVYFFTNNETDLSTEQCNLSDNTQHLNTDQNTEIMLKISKVRSNVAYTKIKLTDGTHVLCKILNIKDKIINDVQFENEITNDKLTISNNELDITNGNINIIVMDESDDDSISNVPQQKTNNMVRPTPSNLIVVDGKKFYLCDYAGCERKYTSNTSLKVHLRTHLGIQPFKCNTCKSTFNTTYSLKTHERTHTGSRPYQ